MNRGRARFVAVQVHVQARRAGAHISRTLLDASSALVVREDRAHEPLSRRDLRNLRVVIEEGRRVCPLVRGSAGGAALEDVLTKADEELMVLETAVALAGDS